MRRLRKIQLGGLLLYFLTLVLEVPVIALRVVFVNFMGHVFAPAVSGNVLLLIGVAPTLWSMFALINPVGSGWWLRQQTGGREPSQRERLAYEDAVELLQAHSPEEPVPLPKGWFVLDRNEPDAGVCGNSLMLSRGLMEMSIAKVLSHELNHLASLDGRITLALNRLILQLPKKTTEEQQEQPQQQRSGVLVLAKDPVLLAILALRVFVWIIRKLVRFAKGGLGLWLATPIWGLTGADASTPPIITPRPSGKPTSSPTSSKYTRSSTTVRSPTCGSPTPTTTSPSYASTNSATTAMNPSPTRPSPRPRSTTGPPRKRTNHPTTIGDTDAPPFENTPGRASTGENPSS